MKYWPLARIVPDEALASTAMCIARFVTDEVLASC